VRREPSHDTANHKENTMLIDVTIEGTAPLMLDAFHVKPSDTKGTLKGDDDGPRAEADARLYRDSDGLPVMPNANLFSAIVAAGIFQKVGKRQLTTSASSLVPGSVSVVEPHAHIVPEDWEVDSRPIVNASGSRTVVHRPRFDKWSLHFTLSVEDEEFQEKVVRRLLDDCGRKIGLGVFRPQRKGPFGRFVVTSWAKR
jgi:hypothetical protein